MSDLIETEGQPGDIDGDKSNFTEQPVRLIDTLVYYIQG